MSESASSSQKLMFKSKITKSILEKPANLEAGKLFMAFGPPIIENTSFYVEVCFYRGVDTIMNNLYQYIKDHEIMCESDVDNFRKYLVQKAKAILEEKGVNSE